MEDGRKGETGKGGGGGDEGVEIDKEVQWVRDREDGR